MFENFSFDTPRSPSLDSSHTLSTTRETSRSVSPCSPTGPYPPPRFCVTDLATSFANSRLRRDSQICYDSCASYANMDDDDGWQIPGADPDFPPISRSRTIPSRPHSPSRRMQRQVTARMLCSSTHLKEIESLVSRMVDSKEQCEVVNADVTRSTEVEDEGYDSSDACQSRRSSLAVQKTRFDYRRSSEMKAAGARVCKAIRCKKDPKKQHKRLRSSESES